MEFFGYCLAIFIVVSTLIMIGVDIMYMTGIIPSKIDKVKDDEKEIL